MATDPEQIPEDYNDDFEQPNDDDVPSHEMDDEEMAEQILQEADPQHFQQGQWPIQRQPKSALEGGVRSISQQSESDDGGDALRSLNRDRRPTLEDVLANTGSSFTLPTLMADAKEQLPSTMQKLSN